ncbi:hypothetical protein B4086_5563 [Bacillus cereus]|nr:hypothetical protein B4086_5563 [Bacillus cereus]
MRTRLRKKRDEKLYIAIKRLNEDVAKDFDGKQVEEDSIRKVHNKIKKNPEQVNRVFKDYRKYIGGRLV